MRRTVSTEQTGFPGGGLLLLVLAVAVGQTWGVSWFRSAEGRVRVDRDAVLAGVGCDPVAVELQQVVGGRHQAPLG